MPKESIDNIRHCIAQEMTAFELKFRESMQSKVPLLDKITHYIIKRKGKQVRPMFVFLAAGMHGGIVESTYRGAALVELLHTATLVHDDVVDDAYERRGFFSINALWKNKIAVLVGDYLLSKGLLLSLNHQEYAALHVVSDSVKRMSEGELLQIEKARKLDITEEVYFEIIANKTASLIASCCAMGAVSTGANETATEHMRKFGELVGLAFQLKDDLLDFGNTETGKMKGIDIKERKMTLPLIHALRLANSTEKANVITWVKKAEKSPEFIPKVISFIQNSGGIAYATEKMKKIRDEALQMLDKFEDSVYKDAMYRLVVFTTEREK